MLRSLGEFLANIGKGEKTKKGFFGGDERTSIVKHQNLINARSRNK